MKLVSLKGLDTKTAEKESARFRIPMLTQRIRIEKKEQKFSL